MSKLRDQVEIVEGDLSAPAEGDLGAYVVFTQLVKNGPFVYAGWLNACDDAMAIRYAREHYGRDQKCTAVLAIARKDIAGTEAVFAPSSEKGTPREFQVFVKPESGDPYTSKGTVKAASSAEALEAARRESKDKPPASIWVVPLDKIIATGEGDLVWRLTDQSYRMARGYSSDVRAKWEKIRARPDLEEYEKEDLKEAF